MRSPQNSAEGLANIAEELHKLNKTMSQLNKTLAELKKADISKQVEAIYYAVNPEIAEMDRRRDAVLECSIRSHLPKNSYLSKSRDSNKPIEEVKEDE